MLIGHTGRTRVDEIFLAVALIVIAVRTAMPLGSPGAYGTMTVKLAFSAALAVPAVLLLAARSLPRRRTGLFWVFVTYSYTGFLVAIVDWTRFGSAAGLLALAGIAGHLYYVTAREIKWTQAQSPRSSPPSEPA